MVSHLSARRSVAISRQAPVVLGLLASCLVLPAQAALEGTVPAVSFPSEGIIWNGYGLGERTVGYSFTLSEPKTVTHLGIWSFNGSTVLDYSRPVGIWSSAGNLLASTTLPAGENTSIILDYTGSPSPNNPWMFQQLDANVLLPAGEYAIGAYYHTDNSPGAALGFMYGEGPFNNNAPFTADSSAILQTSGFTYGETMWSGDNLSFSFPNVPRTIEGTSPASGNRPNGYFGPNLRFLDAGEPTFVLGDMNGDGLRNNLDIAPFELALVDVAAYLTAYPALAGDYLLRGDIDSDGSFNNLDISPFEQLLVTPQGLAVNVVPEPGSGVLMMLGVVAVTACCRRSVCNQGGARQELRQVGELGTQEDISAE